LHSTGFGRAAIRLRAYQIDHKQALRLPELIAHLILVATSGGVDVSALGGIDWRAAYLENFPNSQTWIVADKPDHCADIARIACPALLIWGDDDPISPPAVGACLAGLLRNSILRVIPDGTHDLARFRAADVAPHVIAHLEA
jgi:pimeloyl-ACP methyl ester carboxylesterase